MWVSEEEFQKEERASAKVLKWDWSQHVGGTTCEAGLRGSVIGAPGWLSRLRVRLQLRSQSHSSWVRALRQALCWLLGAWSLLQILCLPLSLPQPTHILSLSLSKINIKKNLYITKCCPEVNLNVKLSCPSKIILQKLRIHRARAFYWDGTSCITLFRGQETDKRNLIWIPVYIVINYSYYHTFLPSVSSQIS